MPDLQHQSAGPGERHQIIRLGQIGGDRFLDQNVFPGIERGGRQLIVRLRGGGDDQRVDHGKQRFKRHAGRAGFPADGLRTFCIGIENPHQARAIGGGDLQRMIAAEMTGTGDTDAKRDGEHARLDDVRRTISETAYSGEVACFPSNSGLTHTR